jgi:hypothetical protein
MRLAALETRVMELQGVAMRQAEQIEAQRGQLAALQGSLAAAQQAAEQAARAATEALARVPVAWAVDDAGELVAMRGDGSKDRIGNLRGPEGLPGRDGAHGRDGAPGAAGPKGEPGAPGKDGTPGKDGSRGEPGERGAGINDMRIVGKRLLCTLTTGREIEIGPVVGRDGKAGAPGAAGPRGEPGEPGIQIAVGAPAPVDPDQLKGARARELAVGDEVITILTL